MNEVICTNESSHISVSVFVTQVFETEQERTQVCQEGGVVNGG